MKQNFNQLITSAKQKLNVKQNTLNSRNFHKESYIQHEYLNIQSSHQIFFQNLQFLSTKGSINPQIFMKFLQTTTKYTTTLTSLCKQIIQVLQQENKVRISHQNYSSQVLILAFFLRYCYPNNKITIFTSKQNFKNWQKYFIQNKNTDPQTDLKKLINTEKINIVYFNEKYQKIQNHQENIIIFDIMNANFTDYQPILLYNKLHCFDKYKKTIIYNSVTQQNQIAQFLGQRQSQFQLLQACLQYPIQIQFTQKDISIKTHLIDFLKQDSSHPQKQDIIIFYKNTHLSNTTPKRFISKLSQLLSQHNLTTQIQFIYNKNQLIQQGKNHIFIVQNTKQLQNWNYNYQEVFYVIDYGWNTQFKIDNQTYCYVESLEVIDLQEKTKRISYIGVNKVGKYVYMEEDLNDIQNKYDKATQVMTYILKMIDLELPQHIQNQNPRINSSLELLTANKIIQKSQNNAFKLIDEQLINLCYLGVDPIQAKIIKSFIEIQKDKQQKILTNLVIYSLSILKTRGNLRQTKDNMKQKSVIKPSGVWRRTGYLHSCLQILTKAELIDAGKNHSKSYSRKKTKQNQVEYQVFGNLFDIIVPKKIEFEDMEIQDLIRQYYVNEQIFAQIRQKTDEFREIFNVDQINIKIDPSKNQHIQELLQKLLSFSLKSVAMHSGSKRIGYLQNSKNILPNKQSLISQLNEVPQFIHIMRYSQIEGKKQILMCNTVSIQTYMSVFGQLPSKNSKSYAQHQIQFHGISSSVFNGLYRNNSFQIKKFQQEHECQVELNQQIATITIRCKKQSQSKIKQDFDQILTKIKQKFVNSDKIINYLGNTNVRLQKGGQIKQVIKNNYINQCYLNNLDLEVTQQDLQELFDEFFVLKNIQILPVQPNKFSKSAIITFNSQKDYYRFYSYYNECKYLDRFMQVKPIYLKQAGLKQVESQNYVLLKWYVWKSHKRAIVFFKQQRNTKQAYQTLKTHPNIDGKAVEFEIDKNKLIFNNLNDTVDQIFLEKMFSVYGDILEVEILKTPMKQPSHQQITLEKQIREALQIPINQNNLDRFVIDKIQKHKNGLRKCKVTLKRIQDLHTIINKLNEVKNKSFGPGRLYAQSWFTKPIPILYPSAINLYLQLIQSVIKETPNNPHIQHSLKDFGNNRLYIILKSPLSQTLQYISKQYQTKLSPIPVQLTTLQKDIILSQIGIDNLIDIQEKYLCKLIVNTVKKQLEVMCLDKDVKNIMQEIKARVEDKFFYRISLNNNTYKKLVNDKEKLQSIKNTYNLSIFQIEDFSKTLIFQGSAHHVQNALNYMMHLFQSFTVPEQQLINSQFCLICYTQCTQPYRLQNCSHKFCFSCLDQYISSTLGDMSMFPIKCPHCLVQLTVDDLESLVDKNSWIRLLNMAANQFVGNNAQTMTFCYTAGCKQINMVKLDHIQCDLCNLKYCLQCKQHYHPDMTCEQARLGTDELFKKYMEENNVRVCPNKNCKMPIMRLDGCYRVTCSRCNKSMCFKCDPDKMIAYDDYNDCYKHLNEVHGGYW